MRVVAAEAGFLDIEHVIICGLSVSEACLWARYAFILLLCSEYSPYFLRLLLRMNATPQMMTASATIIINVRSMLESLDI